MCRYCGPAPLPPARAQSALPPSPRVRFASAKAVDLSGGKGGSVGPLRALRAPRVRRNQRLPARSQSLPTSHPSSCPSPAQRPAGGHWSRRGHRPRSRRQPAPSRPPSFGGGWRRICPPRSAARGVPAASRPAHGGGSNARRRASAAPNGGVRLRPRRRHSRRGPLVARPVAARPARHRCSRACGLATTAVRCVHSPHLPAVTSQVPASIDLAATCSPPV